MDVNEITLQSINSNLKQLTALSQNVANVNTPGYLSDVAFSEKLSNGDLVDKASISLNKAPIKETHRSLDVAILSDGFFEINKNKQNFLSKNGHFYIDAEQYLKHSSGGYVMGEHGRIIASDPVIASNGSVIVDGTVIDKIKIVTVEKKSSLSRVGKNLYQATATKERVENVQLKSGSLNSSNVESSDEMVKMIEISRRIQTSQKVINAYDQLLNVGINELGKR